MKRLFRIPVAGLLALVPTPAHASEGGVHLPDILSLFTSSEAVQYWKPIIFAFALAIFFSILSVAVYRKRQLMPGKFQNLMEMLVEGMFKFLESVLGNEAKKYTAFLGTLFFYILGMNIMGILPGGFAPTTNINITASLAILVFLYAQWTGISRLGIVGYVDHLAGQPRDVISWCLVPLMFPMHIIGELAKPFSLALRLFGNITGEDILVGAFVWLGVSMMALFGMEHSYVGVPLEIPFILLGFLLSTIQALVFALLSTVYILMMLPHEEHH